MDNGQASINYQQLIAGFIGAVIMVLRQRPFRGLITNASSVLAGTASATYLTPILGKALGQTDPNYLLGFSFLLGVLGLRGVELVADWIGVDGKPGLDKPVKLDIQGEE
jgi:hypothetical protein